MTKLEYTAVVPEDDEYDGALIPTDLNSKDFVYERHHIDKLCENMNISEVEVVNTSIKKSNKKNGQNRSLTLLIQDLS